MGAFGYWESEGERERERESIFSGTGFPSCVCVESENDYIFRENIAGFGKLEKIV